MTPRGASSTGTILSTPLIGRRTSSVIWSRSPATSGHCVGTCAATSQPLASVTIASSPCVVRLLDVTGLRIGNDEYARENRTFGITTLRTRHVTVRGTRIQLRFRGKIAHEFDVRVDDATLAAIVRRCQHLPGQDLFRYRDERGDVRTVTSTDVNRYLSEHGAPTATAKTFRTWNATVGAAAGLAAVVSSEPQPSVRTLNQVIDTVADSLGNKRAVCRNSYVHPTVVDAYLDGRLGRSWARPVGTRPSGLLADERRTLRLIKHARR